MLLNAAKQFRSPSLVTADQSKLEVGLVEIVLAILLSVPNAAASPSGMEQGVKQSGGERPNRQSDSPADSAWESQNQVTSVSQFSDVRPTDWAYQALSNLVERYGCVAGYPNGTFKGGQAMTRHEAAALLNACLDRVTEVTDELKRLMAEFEKELAVLKGRVDGLEARVGELEANQFSTTTKLKGEASFIIGGTPDFDRIKGPNPDKTTFNYDLRLSFDTSFTGKDLLRTRLRSGNFSSLPFGSSSQIFKLDTSSNTDTTLVVDRLYYNVAAGDRINLTAGALVRNTGMLSFLPNVYSSRILDFFQLAGASGVYNRAIGSGLGFQWTLLPWGKGPIVTLDSTIVAQNGYANSRIGGFSQDSGINALSQLGVLASNWGAAVAYRHGLTNSLIRNPNFRPRSVGQAQSSNSVSMAAYWQPLAAGWAPSVSAGYSYNAGSGGFVDSQSWMVGLQWNDVIIPGSTAGSALGQAPFTDEVATASWLWECFYTARISNHITVTSAVFYASSYRNNGFTPTWGGTIQTTFRF